MTPVFGNASGSARIVSALARGTTSVRAADVYKAGVLAASLTRLPDGVEFTYRPEYLADGRPDVASTLPLTPDPVMARAGAVPPFFAGLLPEGRRLTSLRNAVKTSADDELSLLLAVGSDPVGDVQIVPEGEKPVPASPLVDVERSFTEVNFAEILSATGIVDAVALPGVQDKASAGMISVPAGRSGKRYILKVDPPEFPGVVLDEAFFIQEARRAGLPVVMAEVVNDATGRLGLLVERFDRMLQPDGSVLALAVEDGTQALGLYPADKYNVSAEEVVAAMADICPARNVALRELFRQLVFAWLTGDGDVHAKNLSVLSTADGERRVSPAYDLPSTLPYSHLDQGLALEMQGRKSGLSRNSLLAFGRAIGLSDRVVTRALDDLLDATADLETRVMGADLPFSAPTMRTMVRNLRNRRRLALGAR